MDALLSIVIANYNYGRFLGDALDSIIGQAESIDGRRIVVDGEHVEVIICDAGSTDDSMSIIKARSNEIYWWCSEKDKGQSDAFNKGFDHSTGKYLTWLNADDLLVKGSLRKIVKELKHHPDCQWFTGNVFRFVGDGIVVECKWGPNWYPGFLQHKCSPIVSYGPTTIFSRVIYEQVGKIDINFHYAMDMDLWIRFMMAGIKQRRINAYCWAFRMHECSKTAEFGEHKLSDDVKVALSREKDLCCKRAGYKMSMVVRWLCIAMRVLDGSLIKGLYNRIAFRRYALSY